MEGLFGEGMKLLVMGMGGVLLFLALLVCLMNLMAAFFSKYGHLFPEAEEKAAARPAANSDDEQIAVALAVIKAKM